MAAEPRPASRIVAVLAGIGTAVAVMALGLMGWMASDFDEDGASSMRELRQGTSPMQEDPAVMPISDASPVDDIRCTAGLSLCAPAEPAGTDPEPQREDGRAETVALATAVAVVAVFGGGAVARSLGAGRPRSQD